jgi:hypothetical protein
MKNAVAKSALAGARGGTSAFRAGGRGSFYTLSFASGRAKSVAASWAESQMETIKQDPLWTKGMQVRVKSESNFLDQLFGVDMSAFTE